MPSIVAVTNPRPDTLVPGETGLAVPGKDVRALANALMYCADRREEVKRMGANAGNLRGVTSCPSPMRPSCLHCTNGSCRGPKFVLPRVPLRIHWNPEPEA